MGTVYDNPGIKRFGKPHIRRSNGTRSIWIYRATICGDKIGLRRNFQAAEFTARKNEYDLYGRLS
jgi:hypothetical protein